MNKYTPLTFLEHWQQPGTNSAQHELISTFIDDINAIISCNTFPATIQETVHEIDIDMLSTIKGHEV